MKKLTCKSANCRPALSPLAADLFLTPFGRSGTRKNSHLFVCTSDVTRLSTSEYQPIVTMFQIGYMIPNHTLDIMPLVLFLQYDPESLSASRLLSLLIWTHSNGNSSLHCGVLFNPFSNGSTTHIFNRPNLFSIFLSMMLIPLWTRQSKA